MQIRILKPFKKFVCLESETVAKYLWNQSSIARIVLLRQPQGIHKILRLHPLTIIVGTLQFQITLVELQVDDRELDHLFNHFV